MTCHPLRTLFILAITDNTHVLNNEDHRITTFSPEVTDDTTVETSGKCYIEENIDKIYNTFANYQCSAAFKYVIMFLTFIKSFTRLTTHLKQGRCNCYMYNFIMFIAIVTSVPLYGLIITVCVKQCGV